ncbi:hypothetical protein [Flavobacterium sp.]|uniref:hypothetical protein n=1 Tax=Flavobacterium sp. TaxID=239 RepID=UPI0025C2E989|nr:hypothetical protein [Flavobacterium sp.]
MKRFISMVFFVFLSVSCTSNKKEDKNQESCAKPKDEFQMYEVSEMAALMEQMYVENTRLKDRILKMDSLGQFPTYFLKMEKATFTKGKERDAFFNKHAKLFIDAQKAIYEAEDTKVAFNSMVDQCIACHEVKCGGPIMRIKKLYIK